MSAAVQFNLLISSLIWHNPSEEGEDGIYLLTDNNIGIAEITNLKNVRTLFDNPKLIHKECRIATTRRILLDSMTILTSIWMAT